MQGTVLYGTGDIRFEEVPEPKIMKPTDAIIRLAATCVCGSDLWSYCGISPVNQPTPMGHEYCGIVEEVGSAVKTVKPGQFVIGSFFASDNTTLIATMAISRPASSENSLAVLRLHSCAFLLRTALSCQLLASRPRR